ncbi:hypothetical protein HDF16_001960 [Granulicella aggregans]|uniref:Uncharacterized protein n=1 Tax=Granulicella aggregans TaxID=474949 RepID=A0A7W8E4L6_9BACT|nr:hypothetical protein [Granulicella aggregans]
MSKASTRVMHKGFYNFNEHYDDFESSRVVKSLTW